jgi:HD-like signal output (HDOD) protein
MITANWTEWVSSDAWRDADVSVIPAPPRAFAEVFALAAENDVDARRLMRLVSNDPVFAIRILRLANVAAFAAAGEVTSIELAVVRLGTRAVRNAVLGACLSAWAQAIDVYGRRAVDDIQHAVGTACLASAEEFDAVMTSRHAEVGATALQLWGLPESVREPVRWAS